MKNPLKAIRNLFRRKVSATTRIIVQNTGGGVIWTPQDYENFAKESYLKNVISYRCVDIISKSVASVPWEIKKRLANGETRDFPDHPYVSLLHRPNPDTSWASLMVQTVCYLLLSGNNFYERVTLGTGDEKGRIKEIYALRPDRMRITTDTTKGVVTGYVYTVGSREVSWARDIVTGDCDILHVKSFHPTDDFWGASVTEPASKEIDTANEATRWNKKVLENEGRPGLVFTVGGFLTDEQYDRLEKQLKEEHSGADNARKNLIVEGEKASVLPYGWNPTELDFLEGSRELNRRIAFAYGVPPMLVGIPGDNTFSNYKEARMAFWEDTIIFYLNLLKEELSGWLFPKGSSYFIDYDLNNIPALAPKREKVWDMLEKADFLRLNEKRAMVGLEEDPDGDILLVPTTMIPVSTTDIFNDLAQEIRREEQRARQLADENDRIESGEGEEQEEEVEEKPVVNGKDTSQWEEYESCAPGEEKPYANEFACRLKDPSQYERFARKNNAAKVKGKRIDFIFGIKGNTTEIQAIRYPKKVWTKAEARKHCQSKEHLLFE